MRSPKNSSKETHDSTWNKQDLDRKRTTMKERIDRLAAEWRRVNGDHTEDSTPDSEVPTDLHGLPKSTSPLTAAAEFPEVRAGVSQPSTPHRQIMLREREEERAVAESLFTGSPMPSRTRLIIPGTSSSSLFMRARSHSNASLASSGDNAGPAATRAESVEMGDEPYIRPVVSETASCGPQTSRREGEDEGKTDVEMKDILASTSSLCVQSPRPSRDNTPLRYHRRRSSSTSTSSPLSPQQPKIARIQDIPGYVPDSDEENVAREFPSPSTTIAAQSNFAKGTGTPVSAMAPKLRFPSRSVAVVEIPTPQRKKPSTIVRDTNDHVKVDDEGKGTTKWKALRLGQP